MAPSNLQSPLSPRLRDLQSRIEGYAADFGLDFFPTRFEMLNVEDLNAFAAYGGFPSRYPHWRFGMFYDQLHKGHAYGAQKIYEMVINNDPAYAYLLSTNTETINKMVMAHVYAHVDFFKNNFYFRNTNRRMIDELANHGARIRRYMDRHGEEEVEQFLDRVLSLENLIDRNVLLAGDAHVRLAARPFGEAEEQLLGPVEPRRIKAPSYLDKFVNPPEAMERERKRLEEERKALRKKFPREPLRDVLWFLILHAPLDAWQKDIIAMVRDEAYYFAPQAMTKILNEGWAAYWHSAIMTTRAMDDGEVIEFADNHAGVVRASRAQINPYRLGLMLLRDIEERWDKGRFGPDWQDCADMARRASWDTGAKQGRKKLFEVRKLHNDVTLIDEFLTPELVERGSLFAYEYDKGKDQYVIASREFEEVKHKLITGLLNSGNPSIYLVEANFENRSELLLVHKHAGVDLHMQHADATLENLFHLWTRPVNLVTKMQEQGWLLTFDGANRQRRKVDYDGFIKGL